ncbi:MAG: UDP-N-acetylmuramoyl-L-alanine--D-glutamate ligase [Gemmatimonadales bacterium]
MMESVAQLVGAREVAVIGLGKSGSAASRLLRAFGLAVYASDSATRPGVEATAAALRALAVEVDIGGHDLDRIRRAALVILSPGVPPTAPPVVAAREAGIPVWAEVELGLRALAGRVPYIAVTGTNGKTTTTNLVAHLLATAKRRVRAAGNIGTPVCEVALGGPLPEVLALELSSFQLHDLPSIAPTVGVLTNLAPDHLDRYPSLQDYYRDKLKMFAHATSASYWVTNADNAASEEIQMRGRRRRFSVVGEAEGWFDRDANQLRIGAVGVVDRSQFPLLGDHNVANALAAALAVHSLGVPTDVIGQGLRTAVPLRHRMEPVAEVAGVLWINDSKATNLSSTEVAVAAMDRPFVLLLGGRHKGEPYSRLADHLRRCRAVVAYGEARPLIVKDLGTEANVVGVAGFAEAMATAATFARPGDAVLLSPACSSYDEFANYEERGNRFRAIVEEAG